MRNFNSNYVSPLERGQETIARASARSRGSISMELAVAMVAVVSLSLFWGNNVFGRLFSGILIAVPITYAVGAAYASGGQTLSKKQCAVLISSTVLLGIIVLYSFSSPGL